ncbi:MAG: FAD-binding protein [Burkholderiales bacterium]|nr:FAD-binding protein [Burkholderiales bacterium]
MEPLRTDVLVIGGGIAGCFAAMRAKDMGADVVLLDKATVRRGGSVGPGMDHLSAGIGPESMTMEQGIERARSARKDLGDPNVCLTIDKGCFQRVLEFEKFGVPVREDDGSFFMWKMPERYFYLISYRGRDTKVKLAQAVKKAGVKTIERTMGVDLLTHGNRAIGAVVFNTRTGELTNILAKATILCTGDSGRQYIEPDGLFLTWLPTTNTGDAQGMAYRAGVKLTNMEFVFLDPASLRAGGGIAAAKPKEYMATLLNKDGEKLMKCDEDYGRRHYLMAKEVAEGRGPLYWDFRGLPENILKMIEREMDNEYPITKEWFKQRGLSIRKDLIPIQLVPSCIQGGLLVDERFVSSMEGLYAGGGSTAFSRGITPAATTGYVAGENAAKYASSADAPPFEERQAKEIHKNVNRLIKKKKGVNPISLEEAVRGIATDYVGFFKNEASLTEGLRVLLELREAHLDGMKARNPHEQMRCLEVRNIIEMVEMHIRASLMRKESRTRRVGVFLQHYRADYPEPDPNLEKLIVISKENGAMALSTQDIPQLKEHLVSDVPQYA